MNAHKRHGYTASDLVDIRIAKPHKPAFRAGVMRSLARAGEYRLSVMNCEIDWNTGLIVKRTQDGTRFVTDQTLQSAKYWALHYISRASEWRREFAA